jgi:glucuronoarabinoxylan endo-1,4-beta-xylanase
MKKYNFSLISGVFLITLLLGCGKSGNEPTPDPVDPDPVLPKINITIDKSTKYQTIEGFGFFGAADVWWEYSNKLWNDAWGEKIISDLGITIWRNEIFPPATPGADQEADWTKQKPVVLGLKTKADKYKVNLKFIATVWSPPADLKWACNFSWAGDENATRNAGIVSTKNGGTLNPNKYTEYADWLKLNIQSYKDAGVDLYALSLQNELMFKQTFNSCTYTIPWYNELLINVVPKIKANFPDVKIFGAENMLDMEGKEENWKWFYHSGVKANADAAKNLDILAVHGYSDGVAASSGSELAKMWINHKDQFSTPMNKQAWMTETSGYIDSWEKTGDLPGALNLAMDIHSGLFYGNMSAWVWWQGCQSTMSEYCLMTGSITSKKYYVSKQYYRYIRPGAVRVKSTSDSPEFFVTAYENSAKGTNTIVIINSGTEDKAVVLNGNDLPATFKMYRTNSTTENCTFIKEVGLGTAASFAVPAKTIVTLQAGGDEL